MTVRRGQSTSSYGLSALEELRHVVRAAKADDAMATVTILLPNNIAGIVARRYLAREGLDEQRRGVAALKFGTPAPACRTDRSAVSDRQAPSHRPDRLGSVARGTRG